MRADTSRSLEVARVGPACGPFQDGGDKEGPEYVHLVQRHRNKAAGARTQKPLQQPEIPGVAVAPTVARQSRRVAK